MKKPFIAFGALFVLAFAFMAFGGIKRIENHAAIAKSPVFVVAEPDQIIKRTKKSRESFKVTFTYMAAGTSYKIESDYFDTLAEAEAMAAAPVQIAYAKTAPAEGVFKSEFDKRDPGEGTTSALVEAGGIGLVIAILGTIVLLWQFPWFRRA